MVISILCVCVCVEPGQARELLLTVLCSNTLAEETMRIHNMHSWLKRKYRTSEL